MASYPKGRPRNPFPYFTEVMTGFEYTAAVGMLYEGDTANGLKVIRDIRDRYDGKKRSPFDEAECGHHYARAMASWAAVPALSGFAWDGREKAMTFGANEGTFFWSNGDAWGTCRIGPGGEDGRAQGPPWRPDPEVLPPGERRVATLKTGRSPPGGGVGRARILAGAGETSGPRERTTGRRNQREEESDMIKKTALLVAILLVARPVPAVPAWPGTIPASIVPEGARWVAHLDMEKFVATNLYRIPRKGRQFEIKSRDLDRWLQDRPDQGRLRRDGVRTRARRQGTGRLRRRRQVRQGPASDPARPGRGPPETPYGAYTLYSTGDDEYGAFINDNLIVFSESREAIEKVLDTAGGKTKNFAGTAAERLAQGRPRGRLPQRRPARPLRTGQE